MALSQLQKKILDKISLQPEETLTELQSGKIKINSFKNEFYQDGKSFLHILMESYVADKERFKPLLKFVLNHSNLSIEDYKGRQKSVLDDIFIHFHKEKLLVSQDTLDALYFLIKESKTKISDSSINKALKCFSDYKNDSYFDDIVNTRGELVDDYNWNNIIDNTIIQDNLPKLKFIFEKLPQLKEKIESIKSTSLNRKTYNVQEASNFLTLAIANSDSITGYFLDNFNFDLSGKIKKRESYLYPNYDGMISSPKYEAVPALMEALNSNNLNLFREIFNRLKDKQLDNLLLKVGIDIASKHLLTSICNHEDKSYYKFIKANITNIIEVNPDNFNRKIFLKNIVSHSNISIEDKLLFTSHISHKIVEVDKLRSNNLLDGFFHDIYNKNLNPKEMHLVGDIYNIVNKSKNTIASGANIYTLPLFNNSQLLNILMANGLDITHNPNSNYNGNTNEKINPFHWYLKLSEKLNGDELKRFYNTIDKTEINKVFNTFKLIAPKEISKKYNNFNVLEYALYKLDLILLNNLSADEIKEFSKDSTFLKSLSNPTELFKDNYNKICNLLYENNINFFPENKNDYFYKILCFCDDYSLIDKILEKENKTIYELSQDPNFWNYVTNPKLSFYVKTQGADYSCAKMTGKIAFADSNVFGLYIQHGGFVDYKDDNQDNILHILIKNNMWSKAKVVVEAHPSLTQEINNQNKLPLSYMIVDFNKECERNKNKKSGSVDSSFIKSMDLFKTYLTLGKLNTNPKSKKILEEQMKKYTHIKEVIPEVESLILYKNIESLIPDGKIHIKEKKIKI